MADRPASSEIQMDMLYDDRTNLPLYAEDTPPSRFCTLARVSPTFQLTLSRSLILS